MKKEGEQKRGTEVMGQDNGRTELKRFFDGRENGMALRVTCPTFYEF